MTPAIRMGRLAMCAATLAAWLAAWTGPQPAARADDATMTGNWGGVRSLLSHAGFDLSGNYTGEIVGNLAGGILRGTIYEDRFTAALDIHPEKFSAWQGATLHATMYRIDGHGPSANLVGNFLDVSSIEALPSTRLFTLWLEQELFDKRLSLRFGQLALDDEFMISATSSDFVNSTFGNPAINAADMIGGGPVYPVAEPGVRLKYQPRDDLAVLAAVFSGNPGGDQCQAPVQVCNPSGTTFSFSGGTLWLGEVQYSVKLGKAGLPGTYKLGGWRETGAFPDQHLGRDAAGAPVSLASPAALGPLDRTGDFAIYAVADQMLWRQPGTSDQGVSGFLRAAGAPSDRNLVSFYVDGGFGWKGPVPGRASDAAMLGVAYAAISPDAANLDRDLAAVKPGQPIRDYEAVVEASYVAQIKGWWTVQPDLQYVMHPGGNIPNPKGPPTPIHNAVLLGLRTTVTF